jgi:urease accessory protein
VDARAALRVGAGGRILRMVDAPPVGWRPTPEAVYLVGTAGGPTGDDSVHLDVEVEATGRLRVRSSAATVVYHGTGTTQRIDARVGPAASLDWAPQPMIITAGAHHTQSSLVRIDPTATLDWTEMVVLGRTGERPGHADLRLDCVYPGGRPLLRHQLRIGSGEPGWDGPAVVGANRAVGVRLRAGPDVDTPSPRRGEGWAWMALDGPGWLLTAVAPELPVLLERMAVTA